MQTCPLCDASITRSAILALRLRKVAVALHRALGHAEQWQGCPEQPCLDVHADLERTGIPNWRRDD